MFKKLGYIALLGLLPIVGWAASNLTLVLDAPNTPGLPKMLRTSLDNLPADSTVSRQGLSSLNMLGSSQFSAVQLAAVIDKFRGPITVVDLRQESHGFVNGNAISWYGPRDWGNLGKTPAEVEADQQKRLSELSGAKSIKINKIADKDDEGAIAKVITVTLPVENTYSEAELTKINHLGYVRFYVTDGWPPDNHQVDRFVQFVKSVPTGTWLYFHCHAGKGRTTTFMAMYDIMRNAKQVSLADILQRQYLLGGHNLTKLPAKSSYKYALAEDRLKFLQNFYRYVATNQDDFKTTWLDWLEQQKEAKEGGLEE